MYKSREPPPKPKEPVTQKERSKLSACIQTEEEVPVPRMSEGLIKISKPVITTIIITIINSFNVDFNS